MRFQLQPRHRAGLWLALGLTLRCCAQIAAPVTSLEVGDVTDNPGARPFPLREKVAHGRARKMKVFALRVGTVMVEGRWAGAVKLPLVTGEVLTPEKLSAAMEALEAAVTADTLRGYGLRSQGEIGVLYIDVDFATNARTVDVTFRPYYVHFSLVKMGDNVLPVPRSAFPTFYNNVPRPLLALNPSASVSYDRAFGTALGAAVETDLLNLSDPARHSAAPELDRHLDLSLQGAKALEEIYHRETAGLRYHVRQDGRALQEINFRAGYAGAGEPLGRFDHTRQAGFGGGGLMWHLAHNTRVGLDTGYRYNTDELKGPSGPLIARSSAHEQFNRLLLDTIPRPLYGFLRAAVWEDNGWLNGSAGAYQRLAGRIGYAKEIPLTDNQSIGLELVAGAGKVWGNAPAQSRFFGGNSPGQFLYDSPASTTLLNMPVGPILRSFGEGQAGLSVPGGRRGGDSFWHVNLNLTLPIPYFSRALIPNELTDLEDENGNPTSLKQLLRRQIDVTGPSMLAATLTQQGLSDAEAAAKAESILEEIKPATHYIINDANLYSVKPLLMFDAAGLSGGGLAGQTWLTAGGGLQLTIVTAKLEVGYMHTLSGPTFGQRGNFFSGSSSKIFFDSVAASRQNAAK